MGQTCCESKDNINMNNPTNSTNHLTNYQKYPQPENYQLKTPLVNKEVNYKVPDDNLETAQDEMNNDVQIIDASLEHSNIDRHASIGSSVKNDFTQDNIEQISVAKKSNNEYNNSVKNNSSFNLYKEVNPNNNKNKQI